MERRVTFGLSVLALASGCARRGPSTACARIVGTWTGVGIEADAGADPEALELVTRMARNDRWRITRVTDTGLQRERVSQSSGHVIGDAMYVRRDEASRCIVDVTTRDGPRPVTFTVRPDGRLEVQSGEGWYAELLQRAH